MFDHVYVVANGQCIYQGEGQNIVPYMETIGLRCPVTYNPAGNLLIQMYYFNETNIQFNIFYYPQTLVSILFKKSA